MDTCFRDPGARFSLEKGIRDGSKVDRKAPVLSEVIVGGRGPAPRCWEGGRGGASGAPKTGSERGRQAGRRIGDDEAREWLMGPVCVAAGATCGLRRDELGGGLLKKVPTEEVTWKGKAMPIKSGAPGRPCGSGG